MKTRSATLFALALAACGTKNSAFDKMADNRWADKVDACGRRFTTFNDNTVRWHTPDGSVDFGHIAIVGGNSPTEAIITVEPSSQIKNIANDHRMKPLARAITMGFYLEGDRLQIRGIVGDNGRGGPIERSSIEARFFNLVKCPD